MIVLSNFAFGQEDEIQGSSSGTWFSEGLTSEYGSNDSSTGHKTAIGTQQTIQSDGHSKSSFIRTTSGGNLTTPKSAIYDVKTMSFTIAIWTRYTAGGGDGLWCKDQSDPYTGWLLPFGNNLFYGASTGDTWGFAAGRTLGTLTQGWRHIVLTRNGTSVAIYVDGTIRDSWTTSSDVKDSISGFQFGRWQTGLTQYNEPIGRADFFRYGMTHTQIRDLYWKTWRPRQ